MIPVNRPWLDEREAAFLQEALASGWISGKGPFVSRFEKEWAGLCERRHGVAVCNGTAALETAIYALELPRGSRVLMPVFSIIACLAAVVRNGLKPVFVDADPRTWCMDVSSLESRLTPDVKAIMVVHTYGHPVDMDPVLVLAHKHGLRIIEDAAEAHGARCRGRICGSFGDVSAFSFYANKNITTGEGGMVVCDDGEQAERARLYRDSFFSDTRRFQHAEFGQNYRFSNLHAAIGCAQILKFQDSLVRKNEMACLYAERLRGIPDLQLPVCEDWAKPSYWVYGIVLGDSYPFDAAELARRLQARGIETRPFFMGLHEQPAGRALGYGVDEEYPVAERLARRGLYLPSGLGTTRDEISTVAEAVKLCLGRC